MDIKIINKNREIINVSDCSIMARGNCLIGIDANNKTRLIQEFEDDKEAMEVLEDLITTMQRANCENLVYCINGSLKINEKEWF